MPQVVTLTIADIVRDPAYQVRGRLNEGAVLRYARAYGAGQELPPVSVGMVAGVVILMDGWHRLAALDRIGRRQVEATVEELSDQEARWRAASANLMHGVPLSASEHRAVFKAFVASGHHRKRGRLKSYREMAAELGGLRAHTTLRNWMRSDFPSVWASMGGEGDEDGTAFERTTPDVGARLVDLINRSIDEVRAAARGVSCASDRAAIIVAVEALLIDLKAPKPWTIPDEEF